MKVLIIGSGGREHCLAWKIAQNNNVSNIYAIPGNPGISQIAHCQDIPLGKENFKEIAGFAREKGVDFTIVGPEAPLVDGIVDFFQGLGLAIFGPGKKAAKIEGSKIFTKELCRKYGIPTPDCQKFSRGEYDKAIKYLIKFKDDDYPLVLKVDGLAAGKGVMIVDSRQKAIEELDNCLLKNNFGAASDAIIIERFIKGFEVSLLSLCDGNNLVPMVLAQDYKKIFDQDKGKNTGGMGSYCPVPLVSESLYKKILEEIIYPTYHALRQEGIIYRGILYGGIIISGGQPLLLEYNCRFGDPETQAILPRLDEDLLQLMIDCSTGKLDNTRLKWENSRCVCVVLASKGYPDTSSKGDLIEGLQNFDNSGDVMIFHAGTKSQEGRIYTNGGRVLGVVSKAPTFNEARDKIYGSISKIYFNGMQYRKDIAAIVEDN